MKDAENALTERAGLNAVSTIFNEQFKWFFREQPVLDWGIDAQIELLDKRMPTGRLFAVQIKTGASYFKKQAEDYVYYGQMKHLDYWSGALSARVPYPAPPRVKVDAMAAGEERGLHDP